MCIPRRVRRRARHLITGPLPTRHGRWSQNRDDRNEQQGDCSVPLLHEQLVYTPESPVCLSTLIGRTLSASWVRVRIAANHAAQGCDNDLPISQTTTTQTTRRSRKHASSSSRHQTPLARGASLLSPRPPLRPSRPRYKTGRASLHTSSGSSSEGESYQMGPRYQSVASRTSRPSMSCSASAEG